MGAQKMNEIQEKLQDVFRDVFDDEELTIHDATTSNDIEDWDSLAHIQLITAIEKEFGIKFTLKEAVSAKNVGEFTERIQSKLIG
jgi:acyl carrier protein